MSDGKAWLALENGTVMEGRACGAQGEAGGDLVFNTAMTGYHEILTDPSYAGQAVIMTYPLMGNYGVAAEDIESGKPQVKAFVVRELARLHSNYRAETGLSAWLAKHGIPGIAGIDTRAPERTETRQGFSLLPNPVPMISSIFLTAASTSALISSTALSFPS